jgi:hypothetical protein
MPDSIQTGCSENPNVHDLVLPPIKLAFTAKDIRVAGAPIRHGSDATYPWHIGGFA